MPKSKEQKQQEALERQAKSVMTTQLRDLIRVLPGGSMFHARPDGTCFTRDAMDAILAFGRFRAACFQHGIKLPMHEDHGNFSDLEYLLKNLTTVSVGAYVSLYEKELQKTHTREVVSEQIKAFLNDAGIAMEGGSDIFLRYEVKCFKETLKAIKAHRDENIRKMVTMYHGQSSRFKATQSKAV